MKKVIIIPDSFKGTLSSQQICDTISERIHYHFPECNTISVPVADGGEGTADSFLASVGGEKVFCTVKGPFFEDMEGYYALLPDGTAVIEMAVCAGLPLVGDRKNPMKATTFGVGQLIAKAIENGAKKIIVGLGGSATNDCGTGAAAAMGTIFRKEDGTEFIPVGGTMDQIAKIEKASIPKDVEIIAMCDIDNPLYGEKGAAYVFAPQKGADDAMVQELDTGLLHVANCIQNDLGLDVHTLPGGGAAGGLGAGMSAFFGATLQSGIETVLETVCFDKMLEDTDLVFSGEGKLDSQSLGGKAVIGIAGHCKAKQVPLIAIVGGAERNLPQVFETGVSAVFPIGRLPEDFSVSKHKSDINLYETIDNVLRLLKI